MADGNLVRQQGNRKSAMVFGPSTYDVPLLPYERELIKTIGITEEEYQLFAAEVRRKGAIRPAEYEHIPDVVNTADPVTLFFINLAIGLVLTGAAYLLTPKPKMPSAPKSGRVDLESITGASRFTPSRGFDTLSELADYSAPIPIIFGLYDEVRKVGGMLVVPKLVWSRMLSHGTQQQARLLLVVGEQGINNNGIAQPKLEGVFLGNNALDTIYEDFFALYWRKGKDEGGSNRVVADDLIEGTRGDLSTGDPSIENDASAEVFVCPTNVQDLDTAFCHAYTPANNTEFGVYGAIPNGTGYRLNYQVITVPRDDIKKTAQRVNIVKRLKIIGDLNLGRDGGGDVEAGTKPKDSNAYLHTVQDQHHEGEGRQYSPRMGIWSFRSPGGSLTTVDGSFSGQRRAVLDVAKEDEINFRISATEIPSNAYEGRKDQAGEKVDDINSTVRSEQLAADDAMQIGEIFAIGGTTWKVRRRSLARFNPDESKTDQLINLVCIDTDQSLQKKIGIVSESKVIAPEVYIDDLGGVGAGFFPLTKIVTGTIRNNRPAIVTELGIKSSVYQNLQGLCSFPGLPTSQEIKEFGQDNITVSTGTINSSIARSSAFNVYVRKAGLDANGDSFEFHRMAPFFVVVGRKPVSQYNFIQVRHPSQEELEYKIVPLPGAELRAVSDDQEFIQLSAGAADGPNRVKQIVRQDSVPGIGTFTLVTAGFSTTKLSLRLNKEFIRNPRATSSSGSETIPSVITRDITLPKDGPDPESQVSAIEKVANISNLSGATAGRNGAMTYEIAGNSDTHPAGIGSTINATTREYVDPNNVDRFVIIEWTLEKIELPSDHYARANGKTTTWAPIATRVVFSSTDFGAGQEFEVKRGNGSTAVFPNGTTAYSDSNPFKNNNPAGTLQSSGQRFRVTGMTSIPTVLGRNQAFYYQLFGSAQNFSIGESRSAERTYTAPGSKSIRLKFAATVKQQDNHFSGQTQGWNEPTITVVQGGSTNANWNVGDEFDAVEAIATTNPYRTVYSSTGFRGKIAQRETIDLTATFTGDIIFEEQSQYADISLYRNLVQKSNASEPEHQVVYVNEIMPNDEKPTFNDLALAGFSLRASRNFTQLDQLRTWLSSGIQVERLHPDLSVYGSGSQAQGPSNLFTDLVFYLLTDQMGGAGAVLHMTSANPSIVDKNLLIETSRFLVKQELFFNGVVGDMTNLRQFIMDLAPNFLCNFVLADGKFSLVPAVPYIHDSGAINLGPVEINQLFTAGNILEDSLKLEYLSSEERRPFKAVVRYRQETKNKLPEERVVEVKIPDLANFNPNIDLMPQEQFNLTQFCASKNHAIKVAKYFLGLRQLVTHTISFSTTIHGLNLKAGSFIKVITESSPYSSANNGSISSSGQVVSVSPLSDGQYDVSYFQTNSEDVQSGTINISNGVVADSTFHSSVFTLTNPEVSQNVYVVEQLTFSQEGTVDIVASEHPCNDDGSSKLAHLIENGSFVIQPS